MCVCVYKHIKSNFSKRTMGKIMQRSRTGQGQYVHINIYIILYRNVLICMSVNEHLYCTINEQDFIMHERWVFLKIRRPLSPEYKTTSARSRKFFNASSSFAGTNSKPTEPYRARNCDDYCTCPGFVGLFATPERRLLSSRKYHLSAILYSRCIRQYAFQTERGCVFAEGSVTSQTRNVDLILSNYNFIVKW